MSNSILDNTKQILGIAADYLAFDINIIMHINGTFFTLKQLGIGPTNGYVITDATATWDAFISDDFTMQAVVKSYVYLRVRLIFDPPTTSYLIKAVEDQIQQLEWRMNVQREGVSWTPPPPPVCLTE